MQAKQTVWTKSCWPQRVFMIFDKPEYV